MDPMHLLALVCFYAPTPLAALLAGMQALQCPTHWQALAVGTIGTVALAVTFGVATDYLPVLEAGVGITGGPMWKFHLMASPFIAIPLGIYCAISVHRRYAPPTDETDRAHS